MLESVETLKTKYAISSSLKLKGNSYYVQEIYVKMKIVLEFEIEAEMFSIIWGSISLKIRKNITYVARSL